MRKYFCNCCWINSGWELNTQLILQFTVTVLVGFSVQFSSSRLSIIDSRFPRNYRYFIYEYWFYAHYVHVYPMHLMVVSISYNNYFYETFFSTIEKKIIRRVVCIRENVGENTVQGGSWNLFFVCFFSNVKDLVQCRCSRCTEGFSYYILLHL